MVDCSNLLVIQIGSLAKREENVYSMLKLYVDSSLTTDTYVTQDKIDIEDITNNESEFDDGVSNEKEIPLVVEAKVCEYTIEYIKF